MTPISCFITNFTLLKGDLNILHKKMVDLDKNNSIISNLISSSTSNIDAVLNELNFYKEKLISIPSRKKVDNNIDRTILLRIHTNINEILKMVDDSDFLDKGKLPSKHFSEFQAMIDSLGEQYFFSK